MIHKTYNIPNISCGHCTATIKRELSALPGIQNVEADADSQKVSLNAHNESSLHKAENLLVEMGYPPVT